jgi:hypothetical protein
MGGFRAIKCVFDHTDWWVMGTEKLMAPGGLMVLGRLFGLWGVGGDLAIGLSD